MRGESSSSSKSTETFVTRLGKGDVGQQELVFAVGQQRDDDAAADVLHLVGPVVGLADGPENIPHSPPVLLPGTKLPKTLTTSGEKSLLRGRQLLLCKPGRGKPTSISTMAEANFR